MSDPAKYTIAGITPDGRGQKTSSTCWLACYRMLMAWKPSSIDVLQTLRDAKLPVDDMLVRGVYKEELVKTGASLGLMGLAVTAIQGYSYFDLVDRLKRTGPLWSAVDLSDDGVASPTHAVFVYGADEERNHVYLLDPWKKPYDGDAEKDIWSLKRYQNNLVATPFCVQIWP